MLLAIAALLLVVLAPADHHLGHDPLSMVLHYYTIMVHGTGTHQTSKNQQNQQAQYSVGLQQWYYGSTTTVVLFHPFLSAKLQKQAFLLEHSSQQARHCYWPTSQDQLCLLSAYMVS